MHGWPENYASGRNLSRFDSFYYSGLVHENFKFKWEISKYNFFRPCIPRVQMGVAFGRLVESGFCRYK